MWYRQSSIKQPRDNVLLEYGLFADILGIDCVIVGREGKPNVPSDLAGLIYLELKVERKNWARMQLLRWMEPINTKDKTETVTKPNLTPEELLALYVMLQDPRAGDRVHGHIRYIRNIQGHV